MEKLQAYYCGEMFGAYQYFGAHLCNMDGTDGVMFRLYAPNALCVEVIGEFNGWHGQNMQKEENSGVFSCFIPSVAPGMLYKYRICAKNGEKQEKADPYGFGMEFRPKSASVIVDIRNFKFNDKQYLKKRTKNYNEPLNIYEIHAGSWKKRGTACEDWYSYQELATLLLPYLKEHHYTHVELLPIAEHPADCSWGYQITGFFAPTSRYGTAKEFAEFVNLFHIEGIGVILDFVPVHFAVDSYGLGQFDGTALYEYPSGDTGYSEWGSFSFNYYRGEVRSFLQSAAEYWISVYHVDGLRMDAISNVIYWKGSPGRGVNEGGVQFLQRMNEGLQERHPDVMLIAEDSSNYLKVTAPVKYDGLGFDFKWDMGFMHDTLEFFKKAPWERKAAYHVFTFSMQYFYNELYLLAFSHDETVHGKATILQKMWGNYENKFPQARTLYTYMYTHPGKKLNFMGNEIGHFREWDEGKQIDWKLLEYPLHDGFCHYIKQLSELYLKTPLLYEEEYHPDCFRWILGDAVEDCVYIFERGRGTKRILVVLNLSDQAYAKYSFSYDAPAVIKRLLSSDSRAFGGEDNSRSEQATARRTSDKTWGYSFVTSLSPFGSKIFSVRREI